MALKRIGDVRRGIERQSRGVRALLVVAAVALLLVAGAVNLAFSLSGLPAMLVSWTALLVALYIVYAVVRSVVRGRGTSESGESA